MDEPLSPEGVAALGRIEAMVAEIKAGLIEILRRQEANDE